MAVEFIDCSSLSITYNARGDVTLSFTVISDQGLLNNYNTLIFGSITYTGWIISVNISELEFTQIQQYQLNVVATASL